MHVLEIFFKIVDVISSGVSGLEQFLNQQRKTERDIAKGREWEREEARAMKNKSKE